MRINNQIMKHLKSDHEASKQFVNLLELILYEGMRILLAENTLVQVSRTEH